MNVLNPLSFLTKMMEFTFHSSLITFLILLLLWKLSKKYKGSNGVVAPKLPPGPWKLPIIGSLHHLAVGSLPHRVLRDLARKHGPIMHLQLGEISVVVISDARMAHEVLKTHDTAFASRPKSTSMGVFTYNYHDIAFAPYGDYWRQMRKICVQELLSAKRVRSFDSIREYEVWHMLASIQSSSGSPINLTEKIFELSSTVTSKTAFGASCKDQDLFVKLIHEIIEFASGFDIADIFPSNKLLHAISGSSSKVKKLHHPVDKIFEDIIHEHRERLKSTDSGNDESREDDLIDVLLKINERGGLDFPITTQSIKAIIFDMFSGGTETSATTVLWAMSEMIRKPEVLRKAQAEVRQILKGKGRVHEKDLEGLNYLKMVIKETLRLHPPVAMLLRESSEQREINGYEIPVKTKIIINAWVVNRDPEHWGDADIFEPERFALGRIEVIGSNFEYIPFGGGRRMCPGISFGWANVESVLAQLLYHFDWKLPGGEEPELLDMTERFGASIKRKNDLCLVASPIFPFK